MFLVSYRENRRKEVVQEVNSKWAGAQIVTGLFLAILYYEIQKNENNLSVTNKKYLCLLPKELNINGKILPQFEYRSFFKVPVYNITLQIGRKFKISKPDKLAVEITSLHFVEAIIYLGIKDLKGVG